MLRSHDDVTRQIMVIDDFANTDAHVPIIL